MTETAAAVSAQMRIWKATGNFIRHRYGSPVPNTPQSKKTHRTTIRCLRHPAAEHCATGPANITRSSSSMRLSVSVFGLTVFSGESISGTLQIIREEKLYGALFFPVVFVGTVLALFYVSLQKITYDREKIVISSFPRRTQTLLRRDIRQLECTSGSQGLRTLTLHTDNRRYVIREKQFRVGFPEFFNELIH